jgi:TonB family protein
MKQRNKYHRIITVSILLVYLAVMVKTSLAKTDAKSSNFWVKNGNVYLGQQLTNCREGIKRGRAIFWVIPEYPSVAKQFNVKGDVVIDLLVDENGNVISSKILNGHLLLQYATVIATKQWKFSPTYISSSFAQEKNSYIPVKYHYIITFRYIL